VPQKFPGQGISIELDDGWEVSLTEERKESHVLNS